MREFQVMTIYGFRFCSTVQLYLNKIIKDWLRSVV